MCALSEHAKQNVKKVAGMVDQEMHKCQALLCSGRAARRTMRKSLGIM